MRYRQHAAILEKRNELVRHINVQLGRLPARAEDGRRDASEAVRDAQERELHVSRLSGREQASHNGEIARALDHGLKREDVAELGRVLTGEEEGRRDEHEITVFDSTGLAVQDLAVALAVYEAWRANREADSFVGVIEITA